MLHPIQQQLLQLIEQGPLVDMTLRQIGERIGEPGSPQKIKHHLDQLASKGFIRIDKKNNTIEKTGGTSTQGNLISLPIMGSANCGEATMFADNHVEGYLHVTKSVLGGLATKVKDLFVLRAVGPSMNRANVYGDAIEDGDYVIVDGHDRRPESGRYVVSVIGGVANIKKIHIDKKKEQVVLISESNQDLPPIYIHQNDLDDYLISGTVVKVMKQPDEFEEFRSAAAQDALKELGTMSKKESDYYNNPANFQKYAADHV